MPEDPEKRRARARRYANKRYATDPEHRERAKAHSRKQYAALTTDQKAQREAGFKARYDNDEEFRESVKARAASAYQSLSPEERLELGRRQRAAMSPEKKRAHRKAYADRLRREVIEGYGGTCACCGNSYLPHLTLDHVNGGGGAERRDAGGGANIYRRLRRALPALDPAFQVLCWNCNAAKHHLGECGCHL